MLAKQLQAAKNSASNMVDRARAHDFTKATAASDSSLGAIVGAGSPDGVRRSNFSQANEQYRANRGWVYSAVRLISQRIAGQPIHVAKEPRRPIRGRVAKAAVTDRLEPLDEHPLLDALADPNPFSLQWGLMACAVASLELTGRQLIWAPENGDRRDLWPIPTTWIMETDAARTNWKIRPPGATKAMDLPGDEVVHLNYPDPADPFGSLSPTQRLAEAITADESIAMAQWRAFENGIVPRMALKVGKDPQTGRRPRLTATQQSQLIHAITAAYGGAINHDKPIILDSLIEGVERISDRVLEMDFLNSASLTKSRILQGFGVSPILLGEVEGANRASAYVADYNLVAYKVNPVIELLSQALTKWLGPLFARSGERLRVWIEPAVARDPEMQFKKWSLAANRGLATVNEFRRHVLNLSDIAGGDVLIPIGKPATPAAGKAADQVASFASPSLNPYTLRSLRDGNGNGEG